jgi:hypothetical protein
VVPTKSKGVRSVSLQIALHKVEVVPKDGNLLGTDKYVSSSLEGSVLLKELQARIDTNSRFMAAWVQRLEAGSSAAASDSGKLCVLVVATLKRKGKREFNFELAVLDARKSFASWRFYVSRMTVPPTLHLDSVTGISYEIVATLKTFQKGYGPCSVEPHRFTL